MADKRIQTKYIKSFHKQIKEMNNLINNKEYK